MFNEPEASIPTTDSVASRPEGSIKIEPIFASGDYSPDRAARLEEATRIMINGLDHIQNHLGGFLASFLGSFLLTGSKTIV
jgi:hypothetical protein